MQGRVKKRSVTLSNQIRSEHCPPYVQEDMTGENDIDVRVHKTPLHLAALVLTGQQEILNRQFLNFKEVLGVKIPLNYIF